MMEPQNSITVPILHFIGLQEKLINLYEEVRSLNERIAFLERISLGNPPAASILAVEPLEPGYIDAAQWKQHGHLASTTGGRTDAPS